MKRRAALYIINTLERTTRRIAEFETPGDARLMATTMNAHHRPPYCRYEVWPRKQGAEALQIEQRMIQQIEEPAR